MLLRKLNNSDLWNKIKILREYIKELVPEFKKRTCWSCGKSLNIYDFLSDNLEFSPEQILELWQNPILEFHCCECFKRLKRDELNNVELQNTIRYCKNCHKLMDIYQFAISYNYLKINELKDIWLNENSVIFCNAFCEKYYYRIKKRKK